MDNEHVMDSVPVINNLFTFPIIFPEILFQTGNVDCEPSHQVESMDGVAHKSVNILLLRLIGAVI